MSFIKKVTHTISHLFHPQRSNNYRARLLHPEMILVLSLVAVVGALSAIYFIPDLSSKMGLVLGYASDIKLKDVIDQTNSQRIALGVSPLKENPVLDKAAQAKARDMFAKQYWAHTAPDGTEPWAFFKGAGYDYRYAGENLARDFSTTTNMVKAWMNSPKHKENIVNPRYTQIGVAVENGVLNGVETTLVVQFFGTPRTTLPRLASGQSKKAVKNLAQPKKTKVLAKKETEVKSNAYAPVLAKEENVIPDPELSPLILVKSLLLSIGVMLIVVLIYDLAMIRKKHALRVVGKNVAHILFLTTVIFLIFFFKSGSIG